MRQKKYTPLQTCKTCRKSLAECECERNPMWHATQARAMRQRQSDKHHDELSDGLKAMAAVLDRVEAEKRKTNA